MHKINRLPDNRIESLADPRYPVLMEEVAGESIRLAKDVEERLIADAARFGCIHKRIRTWDEYLMACLAACETEEEVARKEAAMDNLLRLMQQ